MNYRGKKCLDACFTLMVNVIGVVHLLQTIGYSKILDHVNINIWVQLAMLLDMLCNSYICHLFCILIVDVTKGRIVKIYFHFLRDLYLRIYENISNDSTFVLEKASDIRIVKISGYCW